jgi:SAM-dependent methyltransferase
MSLFEKKNKNILIKGDIKTSVLRKFQNDVLKNYIVNLPDVSTILNIGALPTDGDKEGDLYSNYFKNREYYTLDKNREIDSQYHLNLDLHDIEKIDKKFDLILNMSTLEHVENPFLVSENLQKLLNPDGYIFVCTPFFFPIHKDKHNRYSDYWRFTDDALRILFKDMKEIFIKESPSVLHTVVDRPIYYDDLRTTVSGYCALFQKKDCE